MASKNSEGRIDWTIFGRKSNAERAAIAAAERKRLGLTGRRKNVRAVVPAAIDSKVIREKLGLSQGEFARRFRFSERTIQEWEQGRAFPHGPACTLLFAIGEAPDLLTGIVAKLQTTIEEPDLDGMQKRRRTAQR